MNPSYNTFNCYEMTKCEKRYSTLIASSSLSDQLSSVQQVKLNLSDETQDVLTMKTAVGNFFCTANFKQQGKGVLVWVIMG